MNSWFDMYEATVSSDKKAQFKKLVADGKDEEAMKLCHEIYNQDDIMKSVNHLVDLIKEELKFVPIENIIIGGFSQGAMVSLATSLHLKDHFDG